MTASRLHPDVAAHHSRLRRAGLGELTSGSVDDARRMSLRSVALGSVPPGVHVPSTDIVMGVGGRDIAARVYRPDSLQLVKRAAPALVWFHGGGFVLGDLGSADDMCAWLALEAQVVVISVDYRLAPEHPWPAGHEDAHDAVLWVLDHGDDLGIDPMRVAVGGDSAGGHLAGWVARRVASERGALIRLQVLFYPVISDRSDMPSYGDFATGFGLDADEMRWFLEHLEIRRGPCMWEFGLDATPPHPDLAPAYVVTAECDVLRDDAEEYVVRLVEAGVPSSCVRYIGMPHGFAQMRAVAPQADASVASAGHALRAALWG